MAMIANDGKKLYENFRAFIQKYGNEYPGFIMDHIMQNFGNDFDKDLRADVLSQIYAELGILPENANVYKGFLNLVKSKYNIYSNILEIGGGCFPIMAKYIDEEQQKASNGTITVYDPLLITNKLGNIKLIKEEFKFYDSMTGYDLIIGFAPCDATTLIIEEANAAKKEFIVGLCGCTHFPDSYQHYGMSYSPERWHSHIYDIAEKTLGEEGTLDVDYLDDSYGYPYPVLSTRRTQAKILR